MMMGAADEFHHGIVFIELNDVDVAIFLLDAENIARGNSQEMTQNHPVDPAMGQDHEGVVVVFGDDFLEFWDHSFL